MAADNGGAGLTQEDDEHSLASGDLLFQAALPVPSLCHVMDNLAHDVRVHAMKSRPRFVVHFDALM